MSAFDDPSYAVDASQVPRMVDEQDAQVIDVRGQAERGAGQPLEPSDGIVAEH